MKKIIFTLTAMLLSASFANLSLLTPAEAQQNHNQSFGANRRYVAERYKVISSNAPQSIPNLSRYPGSTVLLSSLKMPFTPGGATYNERYMTADSPEKVMSFFKNSLAASGWRAQQCGWSINAEDGNKNFLRVHVISQDMSTAVPSTRFIIEFKEHKS